MDGKRAMLSHPHEPWRPHRPSENQPAPSRAATISTVLHHQDSSGIAGTRMSYRHRARRLPGPMPLRIQALSPKQYSGPDADQWSARVQGVPWIQAAIASRSKGVERIEALNQLVANLPSCPLNLHRCRVRPARCSARQRFEHAAAAH